MCQLSKAEDAADPPGDARLITFSVTTCKRLDVFCRAMDSFLRCCTDTHLIGRWVCVDDNSSDADRAVMTQRYPFFEFVWHGPAERGHARSVRRIWQLCATELLFHTEDDWELTEPLSLAELVDALGAADQVILWRFGLDRDWAFNPRHVELVGPHEEIARSLGFETRPKDEQGWWWPGFSLNPSLIRIGRARGLVAQIPDGERFEFEYALRLHQAGFMVCLHPVAGINSLGDVPAYVLNEAQRDHDPHDLVVRMAAHCASAPERAIEIGRHLDHDRLTLDEDLDAHHALAAAQWYVDRVAGRETLGRMWRRFAASGRLFTTGMAALLKHYGETWESVVLSSTAALDQAAVAPPVTGPEPVTLGIIGGERFASPLVALGSFRALCTDRQLISRSICVAACSDEDRAQIARRFPRVELVETATGRGAQLRTLAELNRSPFVFLIDGDHEFFEPSDFISRCQHALSVSESVGQCLVNAGYADSPDVREIVGMPFRHRGQSFVAHLYAPDRDRPGFQWPHFRLRPSLVRREALELVARTADGPSFEHELARRYADAGWISVFLPGVYHCPAEP